MLADEHTHVTHAMHRVELLYRYHATYPHIHALLLQTQTHLATCDAYATIQHVTHVMCNTLLTTACDRIIRHLPTHDHGILASLHTVLQPIMHDYIIALTSYTQRCDDMSTCISTVTTMLAQLTCIPAYEHVHVACWRVLSEYSEERRVIDGLAQAYQQQLRVTQQHEGDDTVTHTYPAAWKRYAFG